MVTRNLDSRLEGLFFEIDPLPEAAENDDGHLLEEIVAGLFGNETVTEINAAELTTELPPVDGPFLNANPSDRRSRVFDRSPRWAIQSQIAGLVSVRFALVLVMLATVILLSVGIPMLLA